MKEALHSLEKQIIRIPPVSTIEEIRNWKMLAKKGVFQCPFCNAKLKVRSGDYREVHFSHLTSESCEISRKLTKAEKRYSKQVARESENQPAIISMIMDELRQTEKLNQNVKADFGYRAKMDLTEYPDIWLKVKDIEYAISILTDVHPSNDSTLSKLIQKRHEYFIKNGLQPIWFIENKEIAIEKEKNAIVLWDAEAVVSLKTKEDKKWESLLKSFDEDITFFKLFGYQPSINDLKIDVASTYYIHTTNEGTYVRVMRFIKDHQQSPYRAFLLNEGYDMHFSSALVINKEIQLSYNKTEIINRENFVQKYKDLKLQWDEDQIRYKLEKNRKEKELIIHQELEKETIENSYSEKDGPKISNKDTYNLSKSKEFNTYPKFLKELKVHFKINQQQQMRLWKNYVLGKKMKDFDFMVDLVRKSKISTFEEFLSILEKSNN